MEPQVCDSPFAIINVAIHSLLFVFAGHAGNGDFGEDLHHLMHLCPKFDCSTKFSREPLSSFVQCRRDCEEMQLELVVFERGAVNLLLFGNELMERLELRFAFVIVRCNAGLNEGGLLKDLSALGAVHLHGDLVYFSDRAKGFACPGARFAEIILAWAGGRGEEV